MEERAEGVNGLGIKDEHRELKASLSLFSSTFLSFHWTSFLNKLRLEKGKDKLRHHFCVSRFRGEPSEKCKQITLECVY